MRSTSTFRAGELDKRITLQSPSVTQDEAGQPLTTWTDTATVWAHVLHETGMGAIKSGQDMSVVKASIRIRKRAVNAGERVMFGSQAYDIKAVLPDTQGVFIDLACEAVNVSA